MRIRFGFLFCILCQIFSLHVWGSDELAAYTQSRSECRTEDAYKKLLSTKDEKFKNTILPNKYLALGVSASELKQYSVAREHLLKALKLQSENKPHVHYLIGHTFKEEKNYDEAVRHFNSVLDHTPPQNIAYLTRFEFSEIALAKNKYDNALEHLKYLEKRWRGTARYPEVVWRLMEVEFGRNRRAQGCRWARRLYAGYPGHPVVAEWGHDLRSNTYAGGKIGCLHSLQDQKGRIRKLQLSGQSQKARAEIDQVRSQTADYQKYEVDMLLVAFLESSGFPEDALKVLISYHGTHERSFNYQSTLAKVAARAGEYPTAIGAYYKAYRLSSGSKIGREALFSSAFLSYQTQDYDGANRRFSELIRKYPGSGLARDSKWHLAWLTYLRGDYAGAEKKFATLLGEKVRYRRRWSQPYNNDRTKYWFAMSLAQQEEYTRARPLLEKLTKDPHRGFYALAAKTRLAQLPQEIKERKLASLSPSADHEVSALVENEAVAVKSVLYSLSGEQDKPTEETESEETLQTGVGVNISDEINESISSETERETIEPAEPAEENSKDEMTAATEEAAGDDMQKYEDSIFRTSFRDPKLQTKFERAQNLIAIGEYEWAKWELYDIESRTRNRTYLKRLMELYTRIGSFHRAAYISEIYFTQERVGDWDKTREFWTYNFPKAYVEPVSKSASNFNVPQALVFSIIKAESSFHPEAVSPVGARGLMQLMPYTAEQLTRLLGQERVPDHALLDPQTNIRLGTRYLSRLQKQFQEQIPLIAAAYNAGPHRVHSWLRNFGTLDMDEFIEHVPFVETRNYMKKVVRNFAVYNELYNTKNVSFDFLSKPVPVRGSQRPSPRETWESID